MGEAETWRDEAFFCI